MSPAATNLKIDRPKTLRLKITPPRVTRERVARACAELGDAVSVRNVQRKLGSGSFSTIGPWVTDWREKQEALRNEIRNTTDVQAIVATQIRDAIAHTPSAADTQTGRDRWQQELLAESGRWREEIAALRAQVGQIAKAYIQSDKVVDLDARKMPAELNTALARMQKRLDNLEKDLAHQSAALPNTIKAAIADQTAIAKASSKEIVKAIADLPATLRQAPASQVDAELNQRLQNTLFDLDHKAADLAARPDRTDDIVAAIARLERATARRQQMQARTALSEQGALIERIDALIAAITAQRTPKRKTAKRKTPARKARRPLKKPGRKTAKRQQRATRSTTKRQPTTPRQKTGRKRLK